MLRPPVPGARPQEGLQGRHPLRQRRLEGRQHGRGELGAGGGGGEEGALVAELHQGGPVVPDGVGQHVGPGEALLGGGLQAVPGGGGVPPSLPAQVAQDGPALGEPHPPGLLVVRQVGEVEAEASLGWGEAATLYSSQVGLLMFILLSS